MLFFDYELPERLVAQHPAARRDEARLLVVRVGTGELEHRVFRELPSLLRAGDLVVRNDTRVTPARLVGTRVATGGQWEALYLRDDGRAWELLAKTRGYPEVGETFRTATGLTLTLVGRTPERHWLMTPDLPGPAAEVLLAHGSVPLPPYIRKGRAEAADAERYQTVYARHPGSVAAPTAGLHFTPEVFAELQARGVGTASVTLHVGLGTFASVKTDDPTAHAIHAEWCEVSTETAAAVGQTHSDGGRVVAVGTTTARTLETAAASGGVQPFRGESSLFVRPPHRFRAVDILLTNFHLPRTTLLLLVQSLTGGELLRHAYAEAVREEYRFFSYGDAMLVLP